MQTGFRLARMGGIDVAVHKSLLLVFLLVILSLGGAVLPVWHPAWGQPLVWAVALLAGLLFVLSVLVHELAHALVGRALGVPVQRVTLFMFGGVAHLEREAPGWQVELVTAAVGLCTSFVLGVGSLLLAGFLAGDPPANPAFPEASLAALGPFATLLLWLGQVNLALAFFNLVPGFPLDGGRVLRAVVWGITGDLRRATRRASLAGQAFGWLLLAMGVAMMLGVPVPLIGSGVVTGLWLAMLGWFLNGAAVMSHRQRLIGNSLEGVTVARVMHREFTSVAAGATVSELVDDYLLPGAQHAFPVLADGDFVGLVSLDDVRKVPRERWPQTPVEEVMTPATGLREVRPEADAADAMVALGREGVNQLPVVENGKLRGLVFRSDILRLLSLHSDPALAQ